LLCTDLRLGFARSLDRPDGERAVAGDPWLEAVPERRRERVLPESATARSALGARVRQQLARTAGLARTVELPFGSEAEIAGPRAESARAWRSARRAAALAALALLIVPRAVVSNRASGERAGSATIDFRPSRWKEIWLNGERLGYAPARVEGLPAGRHRVHWRSGRETGEFHFEIGDGETLRFQEPHFARAPSRDPSRAGRAP
jgi:hypothetical protein